MADGLRLLVSYIITPFRHYLLLCYEITIIDAISLTPTLYYYAAITLLRFFADYALSFHADTPLILTFMPFRLDTCAAAAIATPRCARCRRFDADGCRAMLFRRQHGFSLAAAAA